jgi:Shedu protein SduA, C-terminal
MTRSRRPGSTNSLSARQVAEYLIEYIRTYRKEYTRFTAAPPDGCGYPQLAISPYLNASALMVYLARDGHIIADYSNEPDYSWHIAGGPAWMIDTEPTQVTDDIIAILRQHNLYGKNIGIYRIVHKEPLLADVEHGRLPPFEEETTRHINSTKILVRSYPIDVSDMLARLTLGSIGPILDLRLPDSRSEFWTPRVIRGLGVTTANRKIKRWFNYLEVSSHVDQAAWDRRGIWARVSIDLRRHFLHAVAAVDSPGAFISFDAPTAPLDLVRSIPDKLSQVKVAIDGFAALLDERGSDPESTFHQYLANNPVILDVYGSVESKPRFTYPAGQSPLGKKYVEPDFLIRYPGQRYRLVELERPSKGLATIRGEPRSGVTQAAWQIGEWKDYIQNHYDLLRERYPGISSMPRTQVVISRSAVENSGVTDVNRYLAMLRQDLAVDEIITYDLLVEQAREAYARLSGALL